MTRVTFTVEASAGKPLEALPRHSAITGGFSTKIVTEANFSASFGVRFPGVFGIDCEGRLPFSGKACNTVAVKSCPTHGSSTSASVSFKHAFSTCEAKRSLDFIASKNFLKMRTHPRGNLLTCYQCQAHLHRKTVHQTPQRGSHVSVKATNTSMDSLFLLFSAETKGLVSRATEQALGVAH